MIQGYSFISANADPKSLRPALLPADGKAHSDQGPLTAVLLQPDRGAPKFRLRDLVADLTGPAALLGLLFGAMMFPEVMP